MNTPKSLFDTTLEFISANVESIECLNDFPEVVGEKIFERAVSLSELALFPLEAQAKIIKIFGTAYKELILKSVDLSQSLVIINEYFEPFIELFCFVTELCLCSCYLGDSHEIFEHFQNFTALKKLCLMNNYLKDGALRKITLPIRMFGKGPKDIEYLNLAGNKITVAMLHGLSAFIKLQYLEISESHLTQTEVEIIEQRYKLKLSNSANEMHPITTKGWATPLIHKWKNIYTYRKEAREAIECKSYFSAKRRLMAQDKLSHLPKFDAMSSKTLVFKRVPVQENSENNMQSTPTPKNSFFPAITFRDAIDDDIFQQYYCTPFH